MLTEQDHHPQNTSLPEDLPHREMPLSLPFNIREIGQTLHLHHKHPTGVTTQLQVPYKDLFEWTEDTDIEPADIPRRIAQVNKEHIEKRRKHISEDDDLSQRPLKKLSLSGDTSLDLESFSRRFEHRHHNGVVSRLTDYHDRYRPDETSVPSVDKMTQNVIRLAYEDHLEDRMIYPDNLTDDPQDPVSQYLEFKVDQIAFTHLYYGPLEEKMQNYFHYNFSDPDIAEDLFQETFRKAWQAFRNPDHYDVPEDEPSIQKWFYKIASHTLIDQYRRQNEGISLDGKENYLAGHSGSIDTVDDVLYYNSALRRVAHPRQQLLLFLNEIGGFNPKDLAAIFGVSQGTVKSRLFRARGAFDRIQENLSLDELS